jgi:Protein of unknown function (DUF3224)
LFKIGVRRACDHRTYRTTEGRNAMSQRLAVTAIVFVGLAPGGWIGNAGGISVDRETMTARGTFDVTVTPQPQDDGAAAPFGLLFLHKQFRGDLQGESRGQMLAAETAVPQSGAYVALELVSGTLHGRRGSFILQHRGTMRKGTYVIEVTVVPDSGTGELADIRGEMKIIIEGRQHSYEFSYAFSNE